MSGWSVIGYRDFWDVPRMMVARHGDETFLFHSRFDEELDDFIDHYEVWRMPSLTEEDLQGSWEGWKCGRWNGCRISACLSCHSRLFNGVPVEGMADGSVSVEISNWGTIHWSPWMTRDHACY